VTSKRLLAISHAILLCLDAILLLCGSYLRKGIKVGIIRDSIDDLLDVRIELKKIQEDLKNGVG